MAELKLQSTLTCPHCGHQATGTMPKNACVAFYDCKGCGETLKPPPGSCCRFLFIRLCAVSTNSRGCGALLRLRCHHRPEKARPRAVSSSFNLQGDLIDQVQGPAGVVARHRRSAALQLRLARTKRRFQEAPSTRVGSCRCPRRTQLATRYTTRPCQ